MEYDVVIVGGGPAGLAAALALGRARRRVLVCDSGPRRNAAAERIHNFVTRDGTPPDEFRQIARQQLATYASVHVRDVRVESVAGTRGAFRVALGDQDDEVVGARRILVCTGMVDELLPIEGFRELWGHAIFQCPYCHGWERQALRWGLLASPERASHLLPFALLLRAWTDQLVVFAHGAVVPDETRAALEAAGIRIETPPVARLVGNGPALARVELTDGTHVPCEVLFAHPPQRQVDLVRALGVDLDGDGFVVTDPMRRQTSVPGIFAAGDLTTMGQGAILAAAAGTHAGGSVNHDLVMDLVQRDAGGAERGG